MVEREPGQGRYAHIEREQRWRCDHVPVGATDPVTIIDRYVLGTRLRLREMTPAGGPTIYKLGQKVRLDPADPTTVRLTNIYLSEDEFSVVCALPAAELRKTRRQLSVAGLRVAIDEFGGRHAGLILAEIDLGPDEPLLPPPPGAIVEVTFDDRYTGGYLAMASNAELAALVG